MKEDQQEFKVHRLVGHHEGQKWRRILSEEEDEDEYEEDDEDGEDEEDEDEEEAKMEDASAVFQVFGQTSL